MRNIFSDKLLRKKNYILKIIVGKAIDSYIKNTTNRT